MRVPPLLALDGRRVGPLALRVRGLCPLRRGGWYGFRLHLEDDRGDVPGPPVLEGIYSVGGRDGVQPWMDVTYHDLPGEGLDAAFFRLVGEAIPPGGHLMVSYEGDEPVHRETMRALALRVPPVLTPLGHLLIQAGFEKVKDWYLAEGGHEGPRKLWADKAPGAPWDAAFLAESASRVHAFLADVPPGAAPDVVEAARRRAERLLASGLLPG